MERMMIVEQTAKEYLKQVGNIELQIKELQDEIKRLKELAVSIGALNCDEKVLSSGAQDKMANTICEIDEKVGELDGKIKEFTAIRGQVMSTIHKMQNIEYEQILYKRYCLMKTWEKIAIEMNISYRHVLRLHGFALIEIEKILNVS